MEAWRARGDGRGNIHGRTERAAAAAGDPVASCVERVCGLHFIVVTAVRITLFATVLGAGLVFGSSARAQETCDDDAGVPPDFGQLIETFPSNNAVAIPRDGFVRFVFRGRVPPRPVVIVRDASDAVVSGTLAIVGSELHWQANAPFAPGARYSATASDIIGGSSEVRFATNNELANGRAPSDFAGVATVTSERSGATDICGDENARSVTVSWRFARSSPWPQSELTYVVYETRGPRLSGPVERARDRGRLSTSPCNSNADQCVTFRLSSLNSSGPACFAVQVYDPYGRSTESTAEKCVNLDSGSFFYGCSVRREALARRDADNEPRSALYMALAAVALAARRARRSRT